MPDIYCAGASAAGILIGYDQAIIPASDALFALYAFGTDTDVQDATYDLSGNEHELSVIGAPVKSGFAEALSFANAYLTPFTGDDLLARTGKASILALVKESDNTTTGVIAASSSGASNTHISLTYTTTGDVNVIERVQTAATTYTSYTFPSGTTAGVRGAAYQSIAARFSPSQVVGAFLNPGGVTAIGTAVAAANKPLTAPGKFGIGRLNDQASAVGAFTGSPSLSLLAFYDDYLSDADMTAALVAFNSYRQSIGL